MIFQKIRNWLSNKVVSTHILFWLLIFLYYMSSNWNFFDDKIALTERYLIKIILQIILTYVILLIFVPYFLNKNKRILFTLITLGWIYFHYVFYTAIRYYYYDPKYLGPAPKFDLSQRFFDLSFFLNELSWFILPAVILITIKYYRDQKEVIILREQKKTTELNLLKNQLNPHFLFNTLNNLYTLALKKSDQTPEVIAKLSSILDYMLYHCNDKFVALADEITLINNYLELEKIRYGKRLEVDFDYKMSKGIKIAPLILLTFVENAFKHGVKEEIKTATLNITLQASEEEILFKVYNSKPLHKQYNDINKSPSIGLQNIQQQLDILYPKNYTLTVNEKKESYSVILKLKSNGL